jgi:hypothetical protein
MRWLGPATAVAGVRNGGCARRWWSAGASDVCVNGEDGAACVDLRWWRRAGGGARVATLEAM